MLRFALIVSFALALPAAAQVSFLGLKNSLVDFVFEQISVPGELEVKAESVEDAEDGATDIVGLTVADADGVWLTIDRLSVVWNASRVLRGELEINRLAVSGVKLARAPGGAATEIEIKEDAAIAETDDDPFDWPRSPIATRVEEIILSDVAIAPGVIGPVGVAFDATGALRDEGDEQALRLNLARIDEIKGRIALDFLRDFAADRLDLTLEADEAAGGLVATLADFPPESASRVSLSGTGPLNDWALSFDARSDEIFAANGAARINAVDRLSATADFRVTPGDALSPALRRTLSPNARLVVDVAEDEAGVIRIREGALTAQDLSLTASGGFDKTTTAVDFDVALEARAGLSDLAEGVEFQRFGFDGAVDGPLDALVAEGRVELAGLTTAAADIGAANLIARVEILGEAIDLDVSGDAAGLRLDRIGPDIVGDAKIALRGAFDGGAATLETLRVSAAPFDLSAEGAVDLTAETARLAYDLNAPDLAPIARAYEADAGGAFAASGALSGPLSAPLLVGEAAFEGLRLDGEDYGFVRLDHDAVFDEAPQGTAALRGDGSRFGPLAFDGGFKLADDRLALSDLVATALGAEVRGAAEVDLATTLVAGDVSLAAPSIARIGAALGQSLDGGVRGDVALRSASGRQDVELDIALTGFRGAGARVARLTAKGAVRDATGAPVVDLALGAGGAGVSGVSLETAALTLKGALAALDIGLDARGALETGEALELSTRARADLSGPAQTARVGALDASVGEASVSLNAPLRVAAENGVTSFRGIDLALPGGGLTGDATLYGSGAKGDLRLDIGDLSVPAALFELPVESGALALDAVFDTRAARAGARASLRGTGMRFADVVADVGALDLEADFGWDGREAGVDASLSGPFGEPVRVSAATQLRPSGGIAPRLPPKAALSGAVNWSGDIGEFWALVPAPGHVLDGATRIALTLGGTIAAPTVGGDVTVTNGRYENLDVGAILVDLDVTTRVEPSGAFVVDIAAEDGSGGPVSAKIELADGQLDATLSATEATLVRRDDVTAAMSLDITAKGPVAGPAIAGVVAIDRAEVRLVAATPPGVADLGPVRIKGEEPEPEGDGAGAAIALDLKIVAPDDIFVRGRGLDSEWMIDLAVRGTAAKPLIDGAIEKRRGLLTFLGAPLDLARGSVRFFERTPPDPQIDVLLEREKGGVTGGIAVTGSASAPDIAFVSRPALPEDEVLPRILFGQSQQSLSPSQALSLAIGVATLLDGTGGTTDDVRSAVGVDVLRIDDGEDGPAVTVGTNIVDGVYVGTTQPVGGGAAKVQVEIEVFDDFTIDSETGADVGTSIGLNWKKDF